MWGVAVDTHTRRRESVRIGGRWGTQQEGEELDGAGEGDLEDELRPKTRAEERPVGGVAEKRREVRLRVEKIAGTHFAGVYLAVERLGDTGWERGVSVWVGVGVIVVMIMAMMAVVIFFTSFVGAACHPDCVSSCR